MLVKESILDFGTFFPNIRALVTISELICVMLLVHRHQAALRFFFIVLPHYGVKIWE